MAREAPPPAPGQGRARAIAAKVLSAVVRWPLCALAPALVAFQRAATLAAAGLALTCALGCSLVIRRARGPAAHLPVLRVAYPMVIPAAVLVPLVAISLVRPVAGLGPGGWLLVLVTTQLVAVAVEGLRRSSSAPRRVRIAFVGDAAAARRLAEDLKGAPTQSCLLVGRIATAEEAAVEDGVRVIGRLGDLRRSLVAARVELVVLGGAVARLRVFDELAEGCLDLPIRLIELPAFYEEVFGHVPTAEINAAWFAHLVDAGARRPSPRVKRAVDVTVALALGLVTAPLLAVLAVIVRLDGGPAIFAQERIGEAGRPFRLFKLRTMRIGAGDSPAWAQENDPRTTRVGRVLRRWHVDELPQLWNVLRGEMSLVGPRPEQRPFVEQLERTLPFYRRRHLTRPGMTGWAQVRCGYARSEIGSAWKLCNDLYYVKHRSLGLDVLVLAETAGLLVFRSAVGAEPQATAWADASLAPEPEIVVRAASPPAAPPVPDSAMVAIGARSGRDGDSTGTGP